MREDTISGLRLCFSKLPTSFRGRKVIFPFLETFGCFSSNKLNVFLGKIIKKIVYDAADLSLQYKYLQLSSINIALLLAVLSDTCHGTCYSNYLRTVPTFVIAHTFCASRDNHVSYGWCLQIQGYFCVV